MLDEIILIDDSHVTNKVNQQLIRQLHPDLPIKIFENGEDGLRYLIEAQDDQLKTLIFLDLEMPVMTGFEFLDVYENAIAYQEHYFTICLLSNQCTEEYKPISNVPCVLEQLPKPLTKVRLKTILEQAIQATNTYPKRRAFG